MTTETKYFTPADARKTLPLVRNIVRDILEVTREMRLIAEEVDNGIENDVRIKKFASEVNGFLAELEEIGCYYKDTKFQIGLVDFPAMIGGEEVYLCYLLGEKSIKFWHSIQDGFAGRKSIDDI